MKEDWLRIEIEIWEKRMLKETLVFQGYGEKEKILHYLARKLII